jgi:hypothetical protein
MKKSFFIVLFSIIGFSFLSAQELKAEPAAQKQSQTITSKPESKTLSQDKLQRLEAAKKAQTANEQAVTKSQLKSTRTQNATSYQKKESVNYERKSVSDQTEPKKIEHTESKTKD